MRRIYGNWKSAKWFIIWFVVMAVGYGLQAIIERKDFDRLVVIWFLMFCMILGLIIINEYFSYLILYPDQSFREVSWLYPKPRVHPSELVRIGFVQRALDKVYQELFFIYKKEGKKVAKKFVISIKAYCPYTLGGLLDHIIILNPQVKLDAYCQDLLNKYHKEPEKLEKNWQEKFKFKWPLPQRVTDVLMLLLLLLCIYLFLHIATMHGWCWGRNNCYPGPMI